MYGHVYTYTHRLADITVYYFHPNGVYPLDSLRYLIFYFGLRNKRYAYGLLNLHSISIKLFPSTEKSTFVTKKYLDFSSKQKFYTKQREIKTNYQPKILTC